MTKSQIEVLSLNKNNSLLVIFESEFLTQSSIKLYVLSKSKDKHVSIITSSKEYGKSGTLLTMFSDGDGNTQIKLNLKKINRIKPALQTS